MVTNALVDWLRNPKEMMAVIGDQNLAAANLTHTLKVSRQLSDTIRQSASLERRRLIVPLVARITIGKGDLTIRLCRVGLLTAIGIAADDNHGDRSVPDHHEINVPFSLRRRGVETRLIVGDGQPNKAVDPVLVSTIAKAHGWFQQLASGNASSINDIARQHNLAASEISRILPLAFLAPDIIEAIIAGRQPTELTAKQLTRVDKLPFDWQQQREALEFPATNKR